MSMKVPITKEFYREQMRVLKEKSKKDLIRAVIYLYAKVLHMEQYIIDLQMSSAKIYNADGTVMSNVPKKEEDKLND